MDVKILSQIDESRQEDQRVINAYKAFIFDENGKIVLENMLIKLKFLDPCENEQDMALNNFAKDLLKTIYWNERKGKTNGRKILNLVKKLLSRRKNVK